MVKIVERLRQASRRELTVWLVCSAFCGGCLAASWSVPSVLASEAVPEEDTDCGCGRQSGDISAKNQITFDTTL